MGVASAARARGGGRGIAWLALLALLVNVTFPSLALRALPPADLFAGALCHVEPGAPAQGEQDKAPNKGACPFCTLLAAPAMPALPAEAATVPLPAATGSIIPRGPPGLAALPAEARPPSARAPPFPV